MYARMHVRMQICVYVLRYVCKNACMYQCVNVCMYGCAYVVIQVWNVARLITWTTLPYHSLPKNYCIISPLILSHTSSPQYFTINIICPPILLIKLITFLLFGHPDSLMPLFSWNFFLVLALSIALTVFSTSFV